MIAELPCFKPDTEYDLHSFVIAQNWNRKTCNATPSVIEWKFSQSESIEHFETWIETENKTGNIITLEEGDILKHYWNPTPDPNEAYHEKPDDSGNFWGFLCLGLFLGLPLVFIIGFFVWYFLSDPTLIIPNEQRTERGLNCDG